MCHHIRTGSLPLGKKDEDKYDNLLIILNSKLPVRSSIKVPFIKDTKNHKRRRSKCNVVRP